MGCRYDEVRNLYAERLASVWMEDSTTEATRTGVEAKVCSFVGGDLDHAMEMLSALWDIASKDEDIKAPASVTESTVGSFRSSLSSVYFAPLGCANRQPRSLGLREKSAHQVDSQRRLL